MASCAAVGNRRCHCILRSSVGAVEADGIDGAIGVSVVILHNLQHSGTRPLPRLRREPVRASAPHPSSRIPRTGWQRPPARSSPAEATGISRDQAGCWRERVVATNRPPPCGLVSHKGPRANVTNSRPPTGYRPPPRGHARITSQPPAWRRVSLCRVPMSRDALWSTPSRRPDESGRGRQECLRHMARAVNVKLFLRGPQRGQEHPIRVLSGRSESLLCNP
jgi:hypothetical protein